LSPVNQDNWRIADCNCRLPRHCSSQSICGTWHPMV
jgi:hypothetical protein